MKKNAFTVTEFLVSFAVVIILIAVTAMLFDSLILSKKNDVVMVGPIMHDWSQKPIPADLLSFSIKDMVVISGVNITGVVIKINIYDHVDILTTDGKTIQNLRADLLIKVPTPVENP